MRVQIAKTEGFRSCFRYSLYVEAIIDCIEAPVQAPNQQRNRKPNVTIRRTTKSRRQLKSGSSSLGLDTPSICGENKCGEKAKKTSKASQPATPGGEPSSIVPRTNLSKTINLVAGLQPHIYASLSKQWLKVPSSKKSRLRPKSPSRYALVASLDQASNDLPGAQDPQVPKPAIASLSPRKRL